MKEAITPSNDSIKSIMLHYPYNNNKIDSTGFTTIHTHYYEFYKRSKAFISRIKTGNFLGKDDSDDKDTVSSISSDMNIHISIPGTFYLIGIFNHQL